MSWQYDLVVISIILNFILTWYVLRLLNEREALKTALSAISKIVKSLEKPKKDSKKDVAPKKDGGSWYKVKLQ